MNKNIRDTFSNENLLAVFLLGAGWLLAASAAADVPRFIDPPFISTGVYCSAIVTADFNGDGISDVGSVDRFENQIGITLGNGDGTFQPTQIYNVGGPSDMKTADLNGDGIPDLVVPLQGADLPKHQVEVLLGNGNGTFGMPVRFESGSGPSSVALGDLNEDGKIDVVVSNEIGQMQGMSVLLGNGDGTLQPPTSYATGNNTNSVVLSDFNGDGHLDAAVVNSGSQTFSILLGNGDGTFGTAVSYPTPYSTPFVLVVADFNQDSHPDLAVTYASSNLNVSVFLGNSDGTFQTAIDTVTAFSSPSSLIAGDLNGDNIPDLAIGDGFLTVLLSKGDGTFEAPVSYTNVGVVTLGQFDGTGGIDAIAFEQRDIAGFTFIAGNGDGTFNAPRSFPAPPIQVWSAAAADLSQDGSADLVLAGESPFDGQGQVSVYLNTGNGILAPRVDYLTGNNTTGVAIGDLNNDGVRDLVAANQGDDSVSVLLGIGGGVFQNRTDYPTGHGPRSIVIADFNNDGTSDLATVNSDSLNVSILIGAGDGSFPTHTEVSTAGFPADMAAGDLNGDGNADLVVIGEQYGQPWDLVSVYLGNGDGTFGVRTDYQVTLGHVQVKIADVDGDTKPDVVAANSGIDVLLNNGDGTFHGPVTTSLSLTVGSLQSGDIDGNGSLDLVVGTYYYANGLLFGNGDGTFSPSEHPFRFGVATALADFNNDGALDVASGTTILLNTGGSHVALASSENPSHAGEQVTFHARVTPTVGSAVPSGTVEFLDGHQTLGTATLVDGKTRFSTSSLSVGSHRIQARYSGDAIFVPRESKKKTQTVQP